MREYHNTDCSSNKGVSWVDVIYGIAMASLVVTPAFRIYFGVSEVAYVVIMLSLSYMAMMRVIVKEHIYAGRIELQFLVLAMGTSAWLLMSNLWTISTERYMEHSLQVAAIAMLVSSTIGHVSLKRMELTMRLTCSVAAVASVLVLQEYITVGSLSGWGMRITDSYLIVSRLIGLAAVFSATSIIVPGRRKRYVLTLILFAGLALSLARGALVVGVVVTTVFMILGVVLRSRRIASISDLGRSLVRKSAVIAIILLCISLVIWGAMQVERTRSLFALLLVDREAGFSGRPRIWLTAWANIKRSIMFGYGIGSSGIMSCGLESSYPHNIILQIWLDGGIIPAVATIIMLLLPYYASWLAIRSQMKRTNLDWLPYLATYSFVMLDYMKSTNSYTARDLFLLELFALHALSSAWIRPSN